MDDTQGSIPLALAEKLYELRRSSSRRTSENAVNAKFAEFSFHALR